jgi:hypothetical protein
LFDTSVTTSCTSILPDIVLCLGCIFAVCYMPAMY